MMTIPIEISARHVHLSAADWRRLFSQDVPTVAKPLSQPSQFVATERVTLEGPGGTIEHVGLVGPLRSYTQVELASTDARRLGLEPPLRDSGHLDDAVEITIIGPEGSLRAPAAIIQQRHIHANPTEASNHGLINGQEVTVRVGGPRGGEFSHVLVRVHADYSWRMHVNIDEGNAFGIVPGTTGEILLA